LDGSTKDDLGYTFFLKVGFVAGAANAATGSAAVVATVAVVAGSTEVLVFERVSEPIISFKNSFSEFWGFQLMVYCTLSKMLKRAPVSASSSRWLRKRPKFLSRCGKKYGDIGWEKPLKPNVASRGAPIR
jgi:hypothetical protein